MFWWKLARHKPNFSLSLIVIGLSENFTELNKNFVCYCIYCVYFLAWHLLIEVRAQIFNNLRKIRLVIAKTKHIILE